MIIDIRNYPKFMREYEDEWHYTWEQSFHTAGFKSATRREEMLIWEYELDDEEYTWFVLRWS